MSTDPNVSLQGITKRYRGVTALDAVDFEAGPGIVGLLGPNGAGTTTLLRIIATVLRPDSGQVRLFGGDPNRSHERHEIRCRLGFLPQDPVLYRSFSAYDVLDYVGILKLVLDPDERREAVREVLEVVDLTDVMHRRLRNLSGGMLQRVAIAAALLGRPDLLVLDEPANGLDPDHRIRLREALADRARQGTVLVSTHQTAEVAVAFPRVLVLTAGSIRFDGAPAELAEVARGRVWLDDRKHPGALRSWTTPEGAIRHIGEPPSGAELTEPTIDDGYLLVSGATAEVGA